MATLVPLCSFAGGAVVISLQIDTSNAVTGVECVNSTSSTVYVSVGSGSHTYSQTFGAGTTVIPISGKPWMLAKRTSGDVGAWSGQPTFTCHFPA